MKTKICSKCKIIKSINKFNKDKRYKKGLFCWCKNCVKIYGDKYRQNNKKEIFQRIHKYNLSHKKEKIICNKKYRELHKEERREYIEKNKIKIRKYQRKYFENHKKECREHSKKWHRKNYKENSIEVRKYQREYRKIRKTVDKKFHIESNLRSRMSIAIKKNIKSLPTMFLIGCSVEYLMYHLQCKFTKCMNWDNYGPGWFGKKEWHVDHIMPCVSFNLSEPSEQRKCFHYTNLQPLWAKDNWSKKLIA